jgi:3-hydroxyethyl bacteriochlorophyllide a dehydrogenase
MQTSAIVLTAPEHLALRQIPLTPPGPADVVVDIAYSGISTGTERLLYTGRMPPFPGLGYPLVPGYESVGRVVQAGAEASIEAGALVFVPGANCYGDVRGLFGGAASRIVTAGARVIPLRNIAAEQATLLALAATAQHALALPGAGLPELIVGHGTLGRLLARLVVANGGAPVVWEQQAGRRDGALGYTVISPEEDTRRDYRVVCDASGDAGVLDSLVARLAPGGVVVLAGFYSERMNFAFPPAFVREARILIAAQWQKDDMVAVCQRASDGSLPLDGLITHRASARHAASAYAEAFADPACLKMILDWSDAA